MSSFVAHALVGVSCFVLARPKTFQQTIPLVLIAGLLGLSPDIDYLFLWLADWRPNPRITHSLAFASAAAFSAWLFVKAVLTEKADFKLLLIFLAAAASHLVMDASVGVTKNPTAWPFLSEGFTSPIGWLPSSGRLDLGNYYFWRNLLLELGIILPMLAFAYSVAGVIERRRTYWWLLLAVVFIASLTTSLNLSR